MENRLQKRSVLTVLLITLLACIAGLSALFACLIASADEDGKVLASTVYLGKSGYEGDGDVFYRENLANGWEKAVSEATTAYAANKNAYVKVILEKDWVASAEGFGTGDGFSSGRIYLPSGANVVMDLNGHKIDRNLSAGTLYGQVMQVAGNLTLTDSVGGATVTGGYNLTDSTAYGGGVYVNGGTLNLRGVTIEDNRAEGETVYGVGVCVSYGGTFNMYSGAVKNHSAEVVNSFGGGVCVYSAGSFNMYGGTVEGNSATVGGGVACYRVSGTAIGIGGGTVRNNSAAYGGGICVYEQGDAHIYGGEIYANSAEGFGGGIFVLGSSQVSNLIIGGGKVHSNVVSSVEGDVFGGGVAICKGSDSASVVVRAEMSGGSIYNNKAVSSCESEDTYSAMGGGIFIGGATFTLTGGEVGGNLAGSFRSNDEEGDLNDLVDGTRTYGGGVAVVRPGSFVMNGGFVRENRATYGGGINADGGFRMSGGSVTDNLGSNGGGVYLASNADVSLSGSPVIENNYNIRNLDGNRTPSNLEIVAADGRRPKIAGTFSNTARVHVYVGDELINSGSSFTQGYGENNRTFVSVDGKGANDDRYPTNGIYAYASPYRYFVSDNVYSYDGTESEQHIVVLADGELGIARSSIKFVVTYSNDTEREFVFGNGAASSVWNYVDCTYGDSVLPETITAYSGNTRLGAITVENSAGVYTLPATPDGGATTAVFSVVVKAKDLTGVSGVRVNLSNDGFTYDGTEKIPALCEVTYNGTELEEWVDYTLKYENYVNAGTATVVVTFKGNYTGTAKATYEIGTSTREDVTTTAQWQVNVYNSETEEWEWVAFNNHSFTYDGTNQAGKIRVLLTTKEKGKPDVTQTVYAQNVTVSDSNQNKGMWIAFTSGLNENVEFRNAGAYRVALFGKNNYKLTSSPISVTMGKMLLELSAENFENFDKDETRLWTLQIAGNNVAYSSLLDKATYVDPQNGLTKGDLTDAYARYRGTAMSLILNNGYTLPDFTLPGGKAVTVSDLLTMLQSISYTPAKGTVGAADRVTEITTTVTLTFNGNYQVAGVASNTIVITKTWYIVNIANNLLTADGSEIDEESIEGWEFGATAGEVNAYAFRPEHGNTLVYSYYLDGEAVRQFALVYSDNTRGALKKFYEVKVENGELAADLTRPLNDENYLYTYNYSLKAGEYTVVITVLASAPETGTHIDWWDGAEHNDYGTVYNEFTFEYTLTVAKHSITHGNLPNSGFEWKFPENAVAEYTGRADNVVSPEIWLNGKLLIEGEDYYLTSSSVKVGKAQLTVHGIGSLEGEFTIFDAYEIVKARNGWQDVPYIMHWTYSSFNRGVNLIKATPYLLDDPAGLWYSIASDENGESLVVGLEHFTVDSNWQVTAEVEKVLKSLPAVTYYLVAHVEGTDNYYELDTQVIPFTVFKANNSWSETPSVNTWTEGQYGNEKDRVTAHPLFGTAHVTIVDEEGNVVYSSDEGIDKLAEAKAGRYTLTAFVDGTDDYTNISDYNLVFRIFKKPGLPWWAAMLIALGSVAVVALVIFILWRKGVFSVVTDKIMLAIRTRVTVEATIASVRAAKMMEDGRKSVEAAKRRDRVEELHKKAEESSLTDEESAELKALEAQIEADSAK